MKHNFGIENEKKGRGKPKREFFEEEYVKQMKKEYDKFLEEKKKKKEVKIDFELIKGGRGRGPLRGSKLVFYPLLQLFGFVYHLSAELVCERTGEFLLALGITGLDIVIGNEVEEVALVVIHLLVESAALCQPRVAMGVRWIIGLCGAPVGFQPLFDDLMAHKGDV